MNRILQLRLSATLMHLSNYNFFSIGWGLGRFPSVGRSHTQNCFGLQFIAMHKIKISSLWQTLGQRIGRWLLRYRLQPCNCWYWRELWPPIRIGMPLQGISVLHYKVFLFVFLYYTMLLCITYENNKPSFKWSVPNSLSGNLYNTFVDIAILVWDGIPQ